MTVMHCGVFKRQHIQWQLKTKSSAVAEKTGDTLCHWNFWHVIGNGTNRLITHEFLLTFHSNYGPILYHFWDKARYWSKTAILFTLHLHSTLTLTGFLSNIVIKIWCEKTSGVATRWYKNIENMFTRFDTIHECGRETDGHSMTA